MSSGPWGDSDPTIPEMDTSILDFHSKAGTVNWTNEDSGKLFNSGCRINEWQKQFDKQRSEKLIRAEFNRANNNYISMFNHAALQGGEEY